MKTRKKIITIAGKLGSGKSTTAQQVAERLHFNHFSSGDFLRNIAHTRGVSIKELMIEAETNQQIDYDIDKLLQDKSHEEDLVIDSRLAFHWIPGSFKVYLEIAPTVAAERMFSNLETNQRRQQSEDAENVTEMKELMIARHTSDMKRYQNLYKINHTDHAHFDLVIDTGKPENTIEVVVKKIIDSYHEYIKNA